jgi:hypothetical protein
MTFAVDGFASIRFPVTQEIYDRFSSANPDLFELFSTSPFNAHMVMWCSPEEYKPIDQELGSTELVAGYSTMLLTPVAKLYGFEVSTIESRPAVYDTLVTLRRNATAVRGAYSAIVVYDGHHVHDGGVVETIHGYPYSVRNVRLTSIAPQGGSLVIGGKRYASNGFTVRFIEVKPRDVY